MTELGSDPSYGWLSPQVYSLSHMGYIGTDTEAVISFLPNLLDNKTGKVHVVKRTKLPYFCMFW